MIFTQERTFADKTPNYYYFIDILTFTCNRVFKHNNHPGTSSTLGFL